MRSTFFAVGVVVLAGCGASQDGDGAENGEDAYTQCVPFRAGMSIRTTTRLCAGTFPVSQAAGEAALSIDADDVTLTCTGTVLVGSGASVGIRIDGHRRVKVNGCTAKGFRYGLVATHADDLALEALHLDDNFTDPRQGWVQDGVQGGGVRLENVNGATVVDSTFARNWNGIELRHVTRATVARNKSDHCSNWGAALIDAHDSELSKNDFSWGIRGPTPPSAGPPDAAWNRSNWYGVDTKDSAGIVVDDASSKNRIIGNDVRYGGDGIFVRAIIGRCPTETWVEGNDVSYSPHFAMETWCDGDTYVNNVSRGSDNGFWLGGGSNIVVRGNHVEGSKVFAMSIMENQGRHIVVEDNDMHDNSAGIMITGRNLWPSQGVQDSAWKNLANSSHIVVQRNRFSGNGPYDVGATYTRSLVVASNCGDAGADARVITGPGAEVIARVGSCGSAEGRAAPAAKLADVNVATLGAPLSLDGAASGGALHYTWLAQSANHRFESGQMPPLVFGRTDGAARESVTFTGPGMFDVDLTVDDGRLAAIAHRSVAVLPVGRRIGVSATQWTFACEGGASCAATFADDAGLPGFAGADGRAVKATALASSKLAAVTPANRQLGLALSSFTKLGFFLRAEDIRLWQSAFPAVVLAGPRGSMRYVPAVFDTARPAAGNVLKFGEREWIYVELPIAGGAGWTRSVQGEALAQVDWIELHTAPNPGRDAKLWVTGMTAY